MNDAGTNGANAPAPGKSCGDCAMCCKLPALPALDKPAGAWCRHIITGGRCGVYETRPRECRVFYCQWMMTPDLSDEWKPDKCGFVLMGGADGNVAIATDPDKPDAWRAPRYYAPLKRFSAQLLGRRKMLGVHVDGRIIVVLPDREVDLGIVPPDHRITIDIGTRHGWQTYDVRVLPRPS